MTNLAKALDFAFAGELRPLVDKLFVGPSLIFNAQFDALDALSFVEKEHMACEQGFRPEFLRLENAGYKVQPRFEPARTNAALVFAHRSGARSRSDLVRAHNMAKPGASLIVAGAKTDGIEALGKFTARTGPIEASISKSHCRIFVLKRGEANLAEAETQNRIGDYLTGPGMFSADGIDPGSKLLARFFDETVTGQVADLGSGWGYLSGEALKTNPAIEAIDLYEADYAAHEIAKQNVRTDSTQLRFFWRDVLTEIKQKRAYDSVIMNPPFHTSRKTEAELGQGFIRIASDTLKPGGRLLMVANRQLPYEKPLEAHFSKVEKLAEQNGYKVFMARR